ncbi:fatty-acyl-CoA synthase [Kibdelosporangium banguiense]|uniref:Fatty-acyl-CoA synthase n=1 Tax=Kibdelosporangium banguiense TaxID=1365924 RepID=A0ABS4TQ07_9PSEU|nr:AMP-binding protein [Kibdelosporangium banguiense]MBP2325991.1 fatty-acyl-CoA synthase [Kibdelosporangium banguiense]
MGAPAWYVTSAIGQLAAHEDKIALAYRGETRTYRELLSDVYRTARALERQGLGRGDGIVLVAGNRPEAFAVRLAAYLLGLRFTSVIPDADSLQYIVADAQAKATITESSLDGLMDADEHPLQVRAQEGDIARIQYTGGTTGRPKGVPSTYAQLGASTRAWAGASAEMPEGMRFLLATPFAHGSGDAALNMLRFGATVEILDGFDPAELVAAVERATAAITYLYPSWLYRLLDHADAVGADLSPLKFVSYGSAPITPTRLRQALARFGPNLVQTYATTEAPAIAMLTMADHAAGLTDRPELLSSVGRPLPGVTVTIKREDGTVAPTGEVGEVCVQSPSAMAGYWNGTALGEVHTGDLGRVDADGYLYLVGRLKDMIIVDGHNHYAGPIEDVLTRHPAVREAAVVGIPDERTGEAVHAFVVLRSSCSIDELHASAGAVSMTISVVTELPMTPLGKPDKNALRHRASQAVSGGRARP